MKKKKLFLFLVLFVVIGSFCFFSLAPKEKPITHILEAKPYSYLTEDAKEYVQEIYEETGEVISTEVNKEENVPYLNPKYIRYLALSEEEKEHVDEIPKVYAVDFTVDKVEANLPTSLDLRNYNGKNYVSALKNQETLDLCWSFTAVEQAESYAMLKLNKTHTFSTRQLDYASSTNGILDYDNENGNRELTSGGNFLVSSVILSNGLGLVNDSLMPFSHDTTQKELSTVLNYGNSNYELDSSTMLPSITSSTSATDKANIIKAAKQLVLENGGAYIGTQAPGYSCSATNTDGNFIVRVDDTCNQDGGHAMQIIGWNDNYSYTYCKEGTTHTSNISSCSSANKVTGTGAWLVRNSWGSTYSYGYIAYDSLEDDIYVFTKLSPMSSRTWDNNYHKSIEAYRIYYNSSYTHSFTKSIATDEKVQKVKFFSYGKGGIYSVSISSSKENYEAVKTITVPYPGVVTVDLSDLNVIITDSSFEVTVSSSNNVPLLRNTISVFTSNVSKTVSMEPSVNKIKIDSLTSNYTSRVYTNTKNIPSNSYVTYTFLNSSGGNASSYFSVSSNVVAKNDLNPLLTIRSTAPVGIYTMRMTYSSVTKEIPIIIGNPTYKVTYSANGGSGTVASQTIEPFTSFTLNTNSFTRTGYHFTGWNTRSNGSGTSYSNSQAMDPITADLNLYAQWEANSYSVQFYSNGGSGSMSRQNFTYGIAANLVANVYTRTNYEFVSWNTKADGTGTTYNDKASVKNLTSTQNGVVKLYAQWKAIPSGDYSIRHYDVDYDAKTIDFIEGNTTQSTYSSYFDLPDGYTLQLSVTGSSKISTGSTVKIMDGSTVVDQFTNIVRGDPSGDGTINSGDLLKIVNHLRGKNLLTSVYMKAADCNDDGNINSGDLLVVVKYLKGTGTIQRRGNSDED